ncbi:MAG: DUF5989 family protein [Myxococcota bacterium]|jgi:hypothetical protein|nr:hypothetical protein [Deltaproteobacteria bacterium]MDP7075266.1 DUF5989 family protein [Myxococcota bacterium]MDP7298419.1 DUF5989 family protein [Myxococcota bacterium]MDP7434496.1 DUF5989 family protein [Myxococcota bacterium]
MSGEEERAAEFERRAAREAGRRRGPVREFLALAHRTRRYWMIPIFTALLLAGLLVVAGGSSVAPLIYALF